MTCTNPFLNKCQGEFAPATKPGHIECKTCGYRIPKPAPTPEPEPEQVEETLAPTPKRKKTTTFNEEN